MATVWNRFFKKRPGRNKILETLPEEILVDSIIGLLDVRDILKLRQVSKSFALLTKKPAVWKRFLPLVRKMPQPLAPLPPTTQYSAKNISSMDIEHIITKAVSLDDNLRSNRVMPWHEFEFLGYGEVSEMVLLPGGHFLITSVTYLDGRCGIMFWVVAHPATGTPSPLFYRETEVKAYALQAKYMTVKGKKGICVSFLRKRHKRRDDTRHIPENAEMGGKEDPEDPWMPLKYECTTIHISMRCIELLTDRRVSPQTPEFNKLCRKASVDPDGQSSIYVVSRIRTGTQLGVISLDNIQGLPYVCVVKRPDQIVLECLDNGTRSILRCLPHGNWPGRCHSIWNFRVLADQNHILTFRAVEKDENWTGNYYLLDLFRIPQPEEKLTTMAIYSSTIRHKEILNVQISPSRAPNIQAGEDPSVNPYLFEDKLPPPPLSLYLRTPDVVEHHTLWPIHVNVPPSPPDSPQSSGDARQRVSNRPLVHYYYDLQEHWILKTGGKPFGVKESLRTIPGAYNALMYEVPKEYRSTTPPVRSLWSYIYKGDDHTRFMNANWLDLPGFGLVHPDVNGGVIGGLAAQDEHEVEGLLNVDQPMMVVDMEAFHQPAQDSRRKSDKTTEDGPISFNRKDVRKRKQLQPIYLQTEVAEAIKKGISAICWDEYTGRVIVATLDRHLHLIDFAYTRRINDLDDIVNDELDMAIDGERERLAILDQAGPI